MTGKRPLRTRFAPTPSGYLHIGNAVNLMLCWALARIFNGEILLRIDDMDRDRYRPEYLEDIFRSLEYLGLDYELGPGTIKEFEQDWSQEQRLSLYQSSFEEAKRKGICFPCYCSRKELRSLYPDGMHKRPCLGLANLKNPATRIEWTADSEFSWKELSSQIQMPQKAEKGGDYVIWQINQRPAYQLCSLSDDIHFGINLIVRGEDLLDSSMIQLHLAEKMGYSDFSQNIFWHHPLIGENSGRKLSKSQLHQDNPWSLHHFREAGFDRQKVFKLCSDLLGWNFDSKESLLECVIEKGISERLNNL
jgi:glutamyl-tRNA synthetase